MPSRRGKILTQFAFSMFTVDCDSATKLRCKIYITKQQKITLNLDLLKQTWIFPFHLDEFKEIGFLLGLLIRTPYVLNSSVKNRLRGGILVNLSTKKYIFVFFVFRIIMLSLFPDQRGWPFRGSKLLRGPWRFYVLDCNSDQQKCTTPGLPDKLVRLSSPWGCDFISNIGASYQPQTLKLTSHLQFSLQNKSTVLFSCRCPRWRQMERRSRPPRSDWPFWGGPESGSRVSLHLFFRLRTLLNFLRDDISS